MRPRRAGKPSPGRCGAAPPGGFRRHFAWRLMLFGCAALSCAFSAPGDAGGPEAEAELLYHLIGFVEWPEQAFAQPDAPLVVSVLGDESFAAAFTRIVHASPPGGRRVVVNRRCDLSPVSCCQVLFIGAGKQADWPQLLARLGGRPVLTATNLEDLCRGGPIVRFHRDPENKVRLRLNRAAAHDAGLTISAKLLRVIEIVPSEEE